MKNRLTQWDTEEKNRKILSMFGKKPPNLVGNKREKPNNQLDKKPPNLNKRWGRKIGKDQARERSKTSLLTWW